MNSELKNNRNYSLEASRGIAAIVVVFSHFCAAFFGDIAQRASGTPLNWLVNGHGAVVFFFVLSGYVLTYKYFCRPNNEYLFISIFKRLPRLWLPAAVSIFLGMLVLSLGIDNHIVASQHSGSYWLSRFGNADFPEGFQPTFLSALWQSISVFFSGWWFYNSSLWTMRHELAGSLLVFAVAPFIMTASRKALILCSPVVFIAIISQYVYMVPFLSGMMIALGASRDKRTLGIFSGIIILVIGLLLLSYDIATAIYSNLIWMSKNGIYLEQVRTIIETIGSSFILATIVFCQPIAKKMQGRAGKWLGELSFPIYLVQVAVITSVSSKVYILTVSMSYMPRLVIMASVTFACILAISVPMVFMDKWWTSVVNRMSKKIFLSLPQSNSSNGSIPFSSQDIANKQVM